MIFVWLPPSQDLRFGQMLHPPQKGFLWSLYLSSSPAVPQFISNFPTCVLHNTNHYMKLYGNVNMSLFVLCTYIHMPVFPAQCEFQRGASLVYLSHHGILSFWNNIWHTVGTQQIPF